MKFALPTLLLTLSLSAIGAEIKVMTYNLGLAHTFVSYAEERLPELAKAIAQSDAEVMCLQEVWEKDDRNKILSAIEESYADVFMTKIKNKKSEHAPTCKIGDLFGKGKFVSCMQTQCKGLDGDEFTDCIINKCGDSLRALKASNRECATSLMAQVGKNPILSLLQLLNPLKKATLFAYKGSNGLMLLSKSPLKNKEVIDWSSISTLNRRQALKASIEKEGKKIDVVCTHLTSDLEKTVPYTGVFESWGEENMAQIQSLKKKTIASEHLIVMGDMNCSVSSAGISPELENNCLELGLGLEDVLPKFSNDCTFCGTNTLNDADTLNTQIDHIYVRGLVAKDAQVTMQEPVTIKTKEGEVKSHLSDHFAIEAVLSLP
ncbi:MAG: hypothetical protein OHK0056_26230 [Bacteriovoracaceae bacterium]